MKTTKEFIEQFGFNKENNSFNRVDFLLELNEFFLELLFNSSNIKFNPGDSNTSKLEVLEKEVKISKDNKFQIFRSVVKQTEKKFWAISNKKVGKPLTPNLWKAFWAVYIVPVMKQLFPDRETFNDHNNSRPL